MKMVKHFKALLTMREQKIGKKGAHFMEKNVVNI